jgi:serine/threonine-protein kinase
VNPPERIGKYEIAAVLGRGGMGTVYRAHDPVLDRAVALKTIFPEMLAEQGMRERFLREARSAARLQHPNIVTIYEFGEADGVPFIAMELLGGEDLADAVERGHLPDLDGRLAVVTQLCDGLAYAHLHGVVHRDVKPSNVTILPGGAVKIVDFGVAWLEGSTLATRTGTLLGTPSYMAPEQFAGGPVDYRVDMWAVGVILHELLTGRRPFAGATVPSLIYQIVHAPLPPIDPRAERVPAPLARIVEQALAKDPAARYPDLGAVAHALRAAHAGSSGHPPPAPQRPANHPAATPSGLEPTASGRDGRTVVAAPRDTAAPATPRHPPFIEDGVFGEARRVQVAVLTPDGATLVAGGTDGSIRLWSLETRMKVATLRNRLHLRTGHGALTTCLACSADGSLLASGHLDGAIYLWEMASGLELDVKLGHDGAVGGIAFPPGRTTLVSAGADATLKFWDLDALRRGDARRELRRQPEAITCMALAQQGKLVVTGHVNRTLRAHDIATHRLVATFHGHRAPPAVLAVSPAGDLVASGGRDGWVRVHALDTKAQLGMHQEHGRGVADLLFLPGGRKVASVAMDNVAVVWSLDDPELPLTILGGDGECFTSLALTRDGRRLICATAEGRFRAWVIPA